MKSGDRFRFEGIPAGKVEVTPLPNLFWSELLPEIDDLAEVQVTLHVYFLLYRKKGSPRYITTDELRADPLLRRALTRGAEPFDEALTRGLDAAQRRGTLLCLRSGEQELYLFNTAESRKAIEGVDRGERVLGLQVRPAPPPAAEPPNIYKLYEQHIGVLTAAVAEELKAAEQEYPPEIIKDAFRIANERNVRTWKYVRGILLNWTREVKHEATERSTRRRKPQFQGKFAETDKSRK